MTETSTIRHHNIIAVGVYLAASLRVSTQKQGIPCLEDFLIGLIAGAEMIFSAFDGPENLAGSFLVEQVHLRSILSSRTFHEVRDQISEHRIGQMIGDKEVQHNDVAASVVLVVPEIAHEIGATPHEVLKILVIAIMATATITFSASELIRRRK